MSWFCSWSSCPASRILAQKAANGPHESEVQEDTVRIGISSRLPVGSGQRNSPRNNPRKSPRKSPRIRMGLGVGVATAALAIGPAFAASPAPAASHPASGPLLAWGDNEDGQLGNGSTMDEHFPGAVNPPADLVATSARSGGRFTVALAPSGEVWAWGEGKDGELGNGRRTNHLRPVRVHLPEGVKVKAVRAGAEYALAVTTTGRVLAWGAGLSGQLGNGRKKSSDVPVFADLPRGVRVTAVSAGALAAIALTSTGRVLAWGDNRAGELGDGRPASTAKPVFVKIPAGTTITAVGAGVDHMLAVTSTGELLAWGSNSSSDLGDGKPGLARVPVHVKLPPKVKVVAAFAGLIHSLALTRDGRVLAWGDNEGGQLGDGTFKNRELPVFAKIPRNVRVVTLAAGRYFSLALTRSGKILAWGDNSSGELGDDMLANRDVPFQIMVPGDKVLSIGAGCEAYTSVAVVRKLVD